MPQNGYEPEKSGIVQPKFAGKPFQDKSGTRISAEEVENRGSFGDQWFHIGQKGAHSSATPCKQKKEMSAPISAKIFWDKLCQPFLSWPWWKS